MPTLQDSLNPWIILEQNPHSPFIFLETFTLLIYILGCPQGSREHVSTEGAEEAETVEKKTSPLSGTLFLSPSCPPSLPRPFSPLSLPFWIPHH